MASLTVDELRATRGGGIRGHSRAQPKRAEKAADDSSKAVPDEKQEKARKAQELERKKVDHVQEQRKIPESKGEDGSTPAVKIAADEKREKARKLREQQEQDRIRKLEAQKLKEEERTQAALDKKREVLLAAQKIQEERKMKSTEPLATKGSDEHMEKVKKTRELLDLEKKRRLEAQQIKEQQKMLAASDKKKQVHSSAQPKLMDDRTKSASSAPIKKVASISAPKKAAAHLPSKKTHPHSATAVNPPGLREPSTADSKAQNSATTAFHSSTAPPTGTDHIPVGMDDTNMEPGPAATHSNSTTTAENSAPQSEESSELIGSSAGSELGRDHEEVVEVCQSDVVGEERESLGTGDEGSRTSLDMEPLEPPHNELGEGGKDEEKETARAKIEQEAVERRKRVDEIMKKAREKDKKQCVQGVPASPEDSVTSQKSFSHNEDLKEPSEQGAGSRDNILNPLEVVSQGFGGGSDARGHSFFEGPLHSSSNIPPPSLSDSEPHGGNQVTHSDDQVTRSGDQVTHSGDQVTHSGDQVTHSGDQVTHSGDQVTHSGDQMTHSGNQIQTHINSELSDESHIVSNEVVGTAPWTDPHAEPALDTVEQAAGAVHACNLAGSDLNNEALCKDDLIQAGGGSPSQKKPSEEAQLYQKLEASDSPQPLQREPSGEQPRPVQDELVEGLPPHQDQLTNVHQDVPQNEDQNVHLENSGDGGCELEGGGGSEVIPPDLPVSDPPPTDALAGEGSPDHHDGVPTIDSNGSSSGNNLHQHSSLGDDHLIVNVSASEDHDIEADQSSSSSVNFEEGGGSSDVLKLLEED